MFYLCVLLLIVRKKKLNMFICMYIYICNCCGSTLQNTLYVYGITLCRIVLHLNVYVRMIGAIKNSLHVTIPSISCTTCASVAKSSPINISAFLVRSLRIYFFLLRYFEISADYHEMCKLCVKALLYSSFVCLAE